jgi:hypothetical protein
MAFNKYIKMPNDNIAKLDNISKFAKLLKNDLITNDFIFDILNEPKLINQAKQKNIIRFIIRNKSKKQTKKQTKLMQLFRLKILRLRKANIFLIFVK